jgi:hypothetical protein
LQAFKFSPRALDGLAGAGLGVPQGFCGAFDGTFESGGAWRHVLAVSCFV